MATESVKIRKCKFVNILDPKDYPRLMIGKTGRVESQIYFMTSPNKGICLTDHYEAYQGIQSVGELRDYKGSLKLFNKH